MVRRNSCWHHKKSLKSPLSPDQNRGTKPVQYSWCCIQFLSNSYLLNPFTIGTCVAQSTATFTNIFVVLALYNSLLGKSIMLLLVMVCTLIQSFKWFRSVVLKINTIFQYADLLYTTSDVTCNLFEYTIFTTRWDMENYQSVSLIFHTFFQIENFFS